MSSPPEVGSPAKRFEDLWIWQQSRMSVCNVYRDFREPLPASRDFGFLDQVRRAALSIMNNIAEGFEHSTRHEFRRFLGIAKASCGEVRSMCYAAEDLDYVPHEIAETRRTELKRLASAIRRVVETAPRRSSPSGSVRNVAPIADRLVRRH